ncbi:MAG: ABC transporter permease [Phycisphaeraceae bacterium]
MSRASESQWQLIRKRFARHHLAVWSLNLLIALYLVAIFAEFVAPYDRASRHLDSVWTPPQVPVWTPSKGWHAEALRKDVDRVTLASRYTSDGESYVPLGFFVRGDAYHLFGLIPWNVHLFGVDLDRYETMYGSAENPPEPRFYLLGADRYGRDLLTRIVFGARISLFIGVVAVVMTFLLGVTIGGISGYVGGRTDVGIQRMIEIVNSFPQLPLWLGLAAAMPRGWPALRVYFAITIVLSLLAWTGLARVVRGKLLSLREEDYALAAKMMGASHRRIIFVHLLPAFASHIIVSLTLAIPTMILGETALSFLGLGLRPPIVSWGVMLQDCMSMQVVATYPWLLMPVVFIVLTVMGFNFLGDGLRDAADPYQSR